MPTPLRLDPTQLMAERYDCSWAELEGVVRTVTDLPAHALLSVANDEGAFEAILPGVAEGSSLRHLVNARIRLRGVCAGTLNDRDRFAGIQLRVPSLDFIQVLDPAPVDPFAIEIRAIAAVNQIERLWPGYHRPKTG